ncbi:phosphotransferase [Candidatus Coxiella mudrowiae]|uniref:phosphotransferase n=1 Tax=Candidatus Coxiella mudrowiae TaxID=2054173 RepID=UPI0012FF202B|nr:phosphotransferase [Candidatus Coxiella mudrowiae]
MLPDFGTVNDLYQGAFSDLLPIQSYPYREIENFSLHQNTSDLYYREMRLFPDWYLERLKTSLSLKRKNILATIFQLLIESALSHPQVCVHRDYHSRNLMVLAGLWLESISWGILDF